MSLWRPESPCNVACLPADRIGRSGLRAAGRLGATATVLLLAVPMVSLLPRSRRAWGGRTTARILLRCLGIRLNPHALPPAGPALLVANHISWLDILVMLAWGEPRILAKCEVRDWPLIGGLAGRLGTLFVDRSRPRQLPRTVGEVTDRLRSGGTVALFAEGTTGCGRGVLPFRPAMFQAAIDAGVPVVPVTLAIDPVGLAGFIGDESLLDSLRRVVRAPRLTVTIRTGRAIHPERGADRRVLARITRTAVAGRLPVVGDRPAGCRPAQRPVRTISASLPAAA